MNISEIVKFLKEDLYHSKRIAHIHQYNTKQPIYKELKQKLPDKLQQYLEVKGIKLYSHQIDSLERIRDGKNILITTPTASGKTLCFNLPVFERFIEKNNITTLYIYPSKALANDQLKTIREIEKFLNINTNSNIYDGDTPHYKRASIKKNSKIILTNPYELHFTLQFHYAWKQFYQNLNFIIIDEIHHYRGIFGSNVAFLIRRLKRICEFYNSNPQFILSSATIANPLEFGEKLIGEKIYIIDNDGAPKKEKYFVLYNPFFYGFGSGEKNTHTEAKELFKYFVSNNYQTLCFTTSRRMAELIFNWIKKEQPSLKDKISTYRAGYLPDDRRKIEIEFKNEILKGIISTNALELGIDIGTLDCVIICGYPGTIISTIQQAGRAGRKNRSSIVILVAFENPLDQYLMKYPNFLFDKNPENIVIDIENEFIKTNNILCAISEIPLNLDLEKEKKYFGEINNKFFKEYENKKNLIIKTQHGYIIRCKFTNFFKLDSIIDNVYKILCNNKLLETISENKAYKDAHKGAVYIHKGETYIVKDINENELTIEVIKKDVDYYTEPIIEKELTIINELKNKIYNNTKISFGEVLVKEQVIGYNIVKNERLIEFNTLNCKSKEFKTHAFWFQIPDEITKQLINSKNHFYLLGGIHGIEHAMIGIMPIKILCDRWDLGGVSYNLHPQTQKTTIFVYESIEGGIGLTKKVFEVADEILTITHNLINSCMCLEGCPACIYSPKCGNKNETLHKETAKYILTNLINYK